MLLPLWAQPHGSIRILQPELLQPRFTTVLQPFVHSALHTPYSILHTHSTLTPHPITHAPNYNTHTPRTRTRTFPRGRWISLDNRSRCVVYCATPKSMQKKMIPFSNIADVAIDKQKGDGKRFEIIMKDHFEEGGEGNGGGKKKAKKKKKKDAGAEGRHFILEADDVRQAQDWVQEIKKLSSRYIERKAVMAESARRGTMMVGGTHRTDSGHHQSTMNANSRFQNRLDVSDSLKGSATNRQNSAKGKKKETKRFSMMIADQEKQDSIRNLAQNGRGEGAGSDDDDDSRPKASRCFCFGL